MKMNGGRMMPAIKRREEMKDGYGYFKTGRAHTGIIGNGICLLEQSGITGVCHAGPVSGAL